MHIVIVGGGVIGLCTAYYAVEMGCQVTILERGEFGHDCCSLGNAGMITPSHFIPLSAPGMVSYGLKAMLNPDSPFYIRPRLDRDLISWGLNFCRSATSAHVKRSAPLLRDLNMASRACYEDLAERFGNPFNLEKRGLLMLCKSQRGFEEEAHLAAQANDLGVQAEAVNSKRASVLEPNVTMDVAGGVYFPQDCHLTPQKFIAVLTEALQGAGVAFVWNTEVTGWRREGTRIAAAVSGQNEFVGDEFVISGGAWSPGVVKGLGLRMPIEAGKGYSFNVPQPRQLPKICSILTEARIAVTPMSGALRFAGTLEIAGLDLTINQRRVDAIRKAIPSYYPAFQPEDFAGLPAWAGLRPCSPDGLPYVGRFGRITNLTAAAGHAMLGLSLGPITGKLVAELLSGQKPSLPLELLSPDRFT